MAAISPHSYLSRTFPVASEAQFARWIDVALRTPFRWGVFDCALMAADAVLALRGYDPAEGIRATYHSPLGAFRCIQSHGGLYGLCASRIGEEVPTAFSQPGDITLARVGRKETLVVDCSTHWLVMSDKGVLVAKDAKGITPITTFRSTRPCHR